METGFQFFVRIIKTRGLGLNKGLVIGVKGIGCCVQGLGLSALES